VTLAEFETIKRLQQERNAAAAGRKKLDVPEQRADGKASLTEAFDTSLYERSDGDKYAGYSTSIAVNDDDMDVDDVELNGRRLVGQYTATKEQINEYAHGAAQEDDILMSREQQAQVSARETSYQKRRYERGPLTPTRADPFAANSQAGVQEEGATFRDVMAMRELEREEDRVKRLIAEKEARGENGTDEHKPVLQKEDTSD
jgi:splicing factor 3B subunit 1